MIHGDFGAGNILVDESTGRAVVVIDFSSIALGDPAIDYAAISTVHSRVIELLTHRNPRVAQYTKRIAFYRGTFALQEALYGAVVGDDQALAEGLAEFV